MNWQNIGRTTGAEVDGGSRSLERLVSLPDVIHQRYAPITGAQQCKHCGGWIVSAQSFWINNVGPICPGCYRQANDKLRDAAT